MSIPQSRSSLLRMAFIGAAVAGTLFVLGMGGAAVQSARQPEPASTAQALYAAPDGSPEGDGTRERPLDLTSALSANSRVLPGDTLWLRGGTYKGTFISELRGTQAAPIIVRQVAGERAIIDSGSTSVIGPALYIKGAWTTYWSFEVMSSDPRRVIVESGSQPTSLRRGMGVDVHGPHTRLINLIVHDLADGLGVWADAEEAEAYGNIVFHNGWTADDRAHGHGIYTQNRVGTRRITDNIIFDQFSHGIHAYGSGDASLDHITLVGNVSFNNGALDKRYYDRNILLGGESSATSPVVENNYTYYTPTVRHGGENNLGYNAGCKNLIARDNYFAGQMQGGAPLKLAPNCAGIITGNVFFGPIEPWIGRSYPNNTYFIERPTGLKVFVRRNQYEPERSHIIVYNWDRLPELTLDLSAAGLDPDSAFELRDAQNFFGPPVVTGRFGDGHIKVGLRGLSVVPPIGDVATPTHTAPEFAVFVLVGTSRRVTSSSLTGAASVAFRKAWQFVSSSKS